MAKQDLWSKRLDSCKSPCLYSLKHSNEVVIGIFYRNGLLDETPENCGVSYAVDGLLYERLCDLGLHVRVTTNFGFSEFIIQVDPDNCINQLSLALHVLLYQDLPFEIFAAWKMHVSKQPIPDGWERTYDRQRFPGTRLTLPVRGTAQQIYALTAEDVVTWCRRYITSSRLFFCITGALSDAQIQTLSKMLDFSWTPEATSVQFPVLFPTVISGADDVPKSVSCLVLSYPFEGKALDLMQLEAVCQLVKINSYRTVNAYGTTIQVPMFLTEPVPELRLKLNCTKQNVSNLADAIHADVVNCMTQLNNRNLRYIRGELKKTYGTLKRDPCEWTRFVGWNAVMGPWCDVAALRTNPHFFDSLTDERIRYTFSQISRNKDVHLC